MVSIRETHKNDKVCFDRWLDSLGFDANVGSKLKFAKEFLNNNLEIYNDDYHEGREIVEILLSLNMDRDTLVAGLLYPYLSEENLQSTIFKENFNETVFNLILGVRQMAAIQDVNTLNEKATSNQVDNLRKMLLSMVEDFRCVIIKLAERISYLRFIKSESRESQLIAANESMNIYAPLANRLGIGQLKWELEDYVFRYQNPIIYKKIAKQLSEKRIIREKYIDNFVFTIKHAIKELDIKAEVMGRPKHIYSIWKKMQKKSLEFDELFDVRAVRIIANKIHDCYAALGVVHTKFKHLPSEFDDYIANPKPNGYQSIHTVILGPEGKTIEIQIRTQEMHEDSELGVAAHWRYKEGTSTNLSKYDEKINWLRKLLSWQDEMADTSEALQDIKSQVLDDRVYVFTPRGDVVDLPIKSTPLDFAYHIHSEVGHRCIGAKVEGRIVPFTYQLQMGEQIDIITKKDATPSRDWLNPSLGFVTSSRARMKIHAWFRKQDREKNINEGKELLEIELSKNQVNLKPILEKVTQKFNVSSYQELCLGIGSGDIRINQILNFISAILNKLSPQEADEELIKKLRPTSENKVKNLNKDAVIIDGVDNLINHLAKCCQPIPGDPIKGFVTKGRGISIHRDDCEQLEELKHHAPERIINTVWSENYKDHYNMFIRVISSDKAGIVKEITHNLSNVKIKVNGVKNKIDFKKDLSIMDFEIEVVDLESLNKVIKKLEQISGVHDVYRLK